MSQKCHHDLIHHPAFTSWLDKGTPRSATQGILEASDTNYIISYLEEHGYQVMSRNEG